MNFHVSKIPKRQTTDYCRSKQGFQNAMSQWPLLWNTSPVLSEMAGLEKLKWEHGALVRSEVHPNPSPALILGELPRSVGTDIACAAGESGTVHLATGAVTPPLAAVCCPERPCRG